MIDIYNLYADLREYIGDEYDDLFFNAPEGDAERCIIKEILKKIADNI